VPAQQVRRFLFPGSHRDRPETWRLYIRSLNQDERFVPLGLIHYDVRIDDTPANPYKYFGVTVAHIGGFSTESESQLSTLYRQKVLLCMLS
jgi:hypothetical protein